VPRGMRAEKDNEKPEKSTGYFSPDIKSIKNFLGETHISI
jgi:hypothetical protein